MSAAIPLPYVQNTPEWEEARRDSIGSSDVPVITGSAPYRSSRLDLWAFKTRRIEAIPVDESTQELFDLGHALEPVIAGMYTIKTGRGLRRARRMLRHPEIEWATASLDRVSAVKGERLIVECKWDPWARFAAAAEEVPPHVQDQVQWQLLVTGYEAAEVAVLMGAKVQRLEVEPDPAYQDNLLYIVRDFWERHVVGGVQPEVDGSEATRLALARLHPHDDGTLLEPTAELHALMRELAQATPRLKAAEEDVARIKNALRAALGDHSGAEAEDWKVTYRRTKDSRTTDWRALAAHYRSMVQAPAETLDEIEERHTTTKEGYRRLVPTLPRENDDAWT